jgi:hypothetical protein
VQPDVVADLALPPGTWHARYPDPTGGCEPFVVPFDAHEAPVGDADRSGEQASVAVDGEVQQVRPADLSLLRGVAP